MREPQRKTIQGREYTVTPLPAGDGLRVFAQLMRTLGPVIESATSFKDAEIRVLAGIGMVAERLDGDTLLSICHVLAKYTTVQTAPDKRPQLSDVFDLHFQGDFLALGQWLVFALDVSFGSFLRGAVAKLPVAKPAASAEGAKSP